MTITTINKAVKEVWHISSEYGENELRGYIETEYRFKGDKLKRVGYNLFIDGALVGFYNTIKDIKTMLKYNPYLL